MPCCFSALDEFRSDIYIYERERARHRIVPRTLYIVASRATQVRIFHGSFVYHYLALRFSGIIIIMDEFDFEGMGHWRLRYPAQCERS